MKINCKRSVITYLCCMVLIIFAIPHISNSDVLDDESTESPNCISDDCVHAHVNGDNTYIGRDVATGDQGGSENTFIGYDAGKDYTGLCDLRGSGYCNGSTFIGYEAGMKSHNIQSIFIGKRAGKNAVGQSIGNTFIGTAAGSIKDSYGGYSGDPGAYNTFIGLHAGSSISETSSYNTYLGAEAGRFSIVGANNIAIGVNALAGGNYNPAPSPYGNKTAYTGASNIHLGTYTDMSDYDLTSTIVIGDHAIATSDNQMVVGSTQNNAMWECGIQTDPSPATKCYGYDNGSECWVCTIDEDGCAIDDEETLKIYSESGSTPGVELTVNYTVKSCKEMGLIRDSYWGSGVTDDDPQDFSINATGGFGQAVPGADLILAGGKSTGSADGGSIRLKTSPAGTVDYSQNDLVDRLIVDSTGKVGIGVTQSELNQNDNPNQDYNLLVKDDNDTFVGLGTALGAGGMLVTKAPDNISNADFFLGYYYTGEYAQVSSSSDIAFYTNWPGGTKTVFYGDTSGNVGIGTETPSHPLEMYSGAHVTAGGVWTDASSRDYKENIRPLSAKKAVEALKSIKPVEFNYKIDKEEQYVGFIAEDVPELVAMNNRKGLSPMDIVAVVTSVVKEQRKIMEQQQQVIDKLTEKVNKLELQMKLQGTLVMSEPILQ